MVAMTMGTNTIISILGSSRSHTYSLLCGISTELFQYSDAVTHLVTTLPSYERAVAALSR